MSEILKVRGKGREPCGIWGKGFTAEETGSGKKGPTRSYKTTRVNLVSLEGQGQSAQNEALGQGCPTFWLPWVALEDCRGPHVKYTDTNNS